MSVDDRDISPSPAFSLTPTSSQSSLTSCTQQASHPEFFTDFHSGTSGKLLKGSEQIRRCDFAIKLTTLVEAGDLTGYYAEVTRELDQQTRLCFFTSDSISQRGRFIAQINRSFGTGGGFTCSFSDQELTRFLQFLKRSQASGISIKKAALKVGKQGDGEIWVLNSNLYVSNNGMLVPPSSSQFIWSSEYLASHSEKVSVTEITPSVKTPFSKECLKEAVELLEKNMKDNGMSALLLMGGVVMSCHYRQIVEMFGGFPVVLACGPPETGKSSSLKFVLSVTGGQKGAFYAKGTNAYFLERSSLSCLPFGIDDPNMSTSAGKKQLDVGELVVDLHNGAKTANLRCGSQQPSSAPIIATNHPPKDDQRFRSRCLIVPFKNPPIGPKSPFERKLRAELEAAVMDSRYSSALGWVISLGEELRNDRTAVQQIEAALQERSETHNCRQCSGWALLLYFTNKILEVSNREDLEEPLRCWVEEQLLGGPSPSNKSSIVIETLEEVVKVARTKPLREVLTYMRTGVKVGDKEVLAIVLDESNSTQSPNTVKACVRSLCWGVSDSRDFLHPDNTKGTHITRNTGERKRATCIYLEKLPQKLQENIKEVTQVPPSQLDSETPPCNSGLTLSGEPQQLSAEEGGDGERDSEETREVPIKELDHST